MANSRYQIIFSGQLVDGINRNQAKFNLEHKLKLPPAKIDALFANPAAIIKKDLDRNKAEKYQHTLREQGLITHIDAMAPETAAEAVTETTTKVMAETAPETTEKPAKKATIEYNPLSRNAPEPDLNQESQEHYPQSIAFEFSGNGKEYFKIWIVNIVLSILTLGIYSAWAKVRNKQYFYGNTTLQGSSFEYTAKPIELLKGRFIAMTFIGLYYGITNFAPPTYQIYGYMVFLPLIIIAMPWVIMKSLQFNAKHSVYRNIRFGFDGSYGGAFKAFILWPIVSITGVLTPFVWHRQTHYFIANSRYGTSKCNFSGTAGDYFTVFAKLFAMGIGAVIFLGIVAAVGGVGMAALSPSEDAVIGGVAVAYVIGYLFFGVIFRSFYISQTTNIMYENSLLGNHSFACHYEFGSYCKLLFTNSLGIIFTLGLFIPFAKVRSAQYHADNIQFVATEALDNFVAEQAKQSSTLAEGLTDGDDLFDIGVGI